MKKLLTGGLLALFMAMPVLPAGAESGTLGQMVYMFCKDGETDRKSANMCISMFLGLVPSLKAGARAGLESAGISPVTDDRISRALGFCAPRDEIMTHKIAALATAYMANNPASQDEGIIDITRAALAEKWPCK